MFNFFKQKCDNDKSDMDIKEPVIEIVNTFNEKGRWKFKERVIEDVFSWSRCSVRYSLIDAKTDFKICFCRDHQTHLRVRRNKIFITNCPDWVTSDEKDYLEKSIWNWYSEFIEAIKNKQRNEVKKLYNVS